MCLRRCFLACLALVGLLFLIRHPDNAAHAVKALLAVLSHLADALARFSTAL